MISIDMDKCIGCLKCVAVCPFTVLGVVDGRPRLKEGKACIKCMHCAAACPQQAVLFDRKNAVLQNPISSLPENFAKDLEHHVMTRRSYRHFKEQPLNREAVGHALEVASWAPSAKNQHPAKWIVIDSKDVIEQIMGHILDYVKETGVSPEIASEYDAGNNVVVGTAPTLILCYARDNAINAPSDTAIAMTTAELIFQAHGIGTCWSGYLTEMCNAIPQIKELLPELPANNSFYGAFMAGYPEHEDYLWIPERIKRADIQWL